MDEAQNIASLRLYKLPHPFPLLFCGHKWMVVSVGVLVRGRFDNREYKNVLTESTLALKCGEGGAVDVA